MRIYFLIVALLFASCGEAPVRKEQDKLSSEEQLVTAKGKKPMRLLTDRPPNLETPLHYFLSDLTPNDVFFVRWHLAGLPSDVDSTTFRLAVGGHVAREL